MRTCTYVAVMYLASVTLNLLSPTFSTVLEASSVTVLDRDDIEKLFKGGEKFFFKLMQHAATI